MFESMRFRDPLALADLVVDLQPGREVVLDVYDDASPPNALNLPLLTVYAVDALAPRVHTACSAVIASQGEEWRWAFVGDRGRLDTANERGYVRLFVVVLNRGHDFSAVDWARATRVLQPLLLRAAPMTARKINFFSLQPVDPLGRRKILCVHHSDFGGQLLVEDVVDYSLPDRPMASLARNAARQANSSTTGSPSTPNTRSKRTSEVPVTYGRVVRRLFFMSDVAAIQSEARVLYPSNQHSFDSLSADESMESQGGHLDASYLPFEYHQVITGALIFLQPLMALSSAGTCSTCEATAAQTRSSGVDALIIGLGGGGLALFLAECILPPSSTHAISDSQFSPAVCSIATTANRLMHITALELDPVVVEVARSHFGCSPDVVDVRVADGIAFVTDLAARIQACGTLHERAALQKHLIVIDVDSKDLTDELLSFPPPPFVDIGYLRHVRSCLRPRGALMMNFGVHKHSMRRQIVSSVIDVFGPQSHVYEISIENDQNRILVAVAPPESDLNASSSASCAACSLPLTREAALAKVPTLARFMSLKASQGLLGDIEVMLRRIKVWHVPNHQPVDADWEMLSE